MVTESDLRFFASNRLRDIRQFASGDLVVFVSFVAILWWPDRDSDELKMSSLDCFLCHGATCFSFVRAIIFERESNLARECRLA